MLVAITVLFSYNGKLKNIIGSMHLAVGFEALLPVGSSVLAKTRLL